MDALSTDTEYATLPSGVRLAVTRLGHVHTTTLFAELSVGSRFETAEDNGLSHFLEHMLFRGSKSQPTAQALALAFDDLGASIEASTSADTGTLSTSMPPESFEAALPLFAEMFEHPVFDAIETERSIVREEILEELDERGRMVDAETLLSSLAYEGHPLAQPITGSIKHLERFDRDRLWAHHERHYTGASTVVTVAGPVDPEKVVRSLSDAFDGIAHGAALPVAPPDVREGPRFRHVRHADSQTALRVAFVGPGALDPSEPALGLVLRLLDDGVSTRLYRRICDELGLCYDVSADLVQYQDTGLLAIAAESAHERARDVLREVFDVIRRLRDEGPEPGELERAKRRYAWSLRELLDDAEGLAEYHAMELWLGRGTSLASRLEAVQAIEADAIRTLCDDLFQPSRLCVLSVGTGPRAELERITHGFQ